MYFPLFISRRIYNDKGDKRQVSRPVIRLAIAGVAIGLAVMIISVCVVLAFKHTIRDKVVGFGSHVRVENFMASAGDETLPIAIPDSILTTLKGVEGVKEVQKYAYKQCILKTESDFLGIMLKGIGEDYDMSFLNENLYQGEYPKFSSEKSSNKIVISKVQADKMHLKVGDAVFGYFVDDDVRMRKFTVSAIYDTKMSKYDEIFAFTDIYAIQKLNGWESDQYSGVELTLNDFNKLDEIAEVVAEKIHRKRDSYGELYSSRTITESNPQIFAWLSLLDMNIWVILGLMVCVAGITMISGLFIIILERTTMIGLLKALGARNKTIRHTFLFFAVFIIGKGLLWGNAIALFLMLLQKYTGLVKLDSQTYYVSEVPIEINIPWILVLNAATLVICTLVLIIPSYLVSHIHPAKAMHFE